jgi:hypothetical protein
MNRLSAKYEWDILLNSALELGICALAVDYANFDYEWDIIDQKGNRHLGPKATTNRSALIELVNRGECIKNNLFGHASHLKARKIDCGLVLEWEELRNILLYFSQHSFQACKIISDVEENNH